MLGRNNTLSTVMLNEYMFVAVNNPGCAEDTPARSYVDAVYGICKLLYRANSIIILATAVPVPDPIPVATNVTPTVFELAPIAT